MWVGTVCKRIMADSFTVKKEKQDQKQRNLMLKKVVQNLLL